MKLSVPFTILLMVTLITHTSFAQSNIDSIRNEVRMHPENAKALLSLARVIVYSNPDSSVLIAHQVLNKGDDRYYSQAYELIANHFHKLGQLDSGRVYYIKALKTYSPKNDISFKLSILTGIGKGS